jgi:hypothetical protein
MMRQAIQDAAYTLQITGSITAAILVAAAPIAHRIFHR